MSDIKLVLRAAAFAAQRHRKQFRKGRTRMAYINHPLAVACALSEEGGVRDAEVLAAAFLHDTIEDTPTLYQELRGHFGKRVADLVVEVTDTKFLNKHARKELQRAKASRASRGAQQIKIADKLCNLREILADPPVRWSARRRRHYFEWAKRVVEEIRGANPRLARRFDAAYRAGAAI